MMDNDILDLLEDIGRSAVARLTPAVTLTGETADMRRKQVLRTIRGTILPRRLEFTAANGDCLAIEVNSSRVTDVFRVRTGKVPDFETTPREELAERLAELVTDMAMAPAPLELISLQPDTALEADDVGITFREIANACDTIELPAEPLVSLVPDVDEDAGPSKADAFFDGAAKFAQGRVLVDKEDASALRTDGTCGPDQPLHPESKLLKDLVRDLSGWDADSATGSTHPKLIVMRPSGGKGDALALFNDADQLTMVTHEARKLGAVVKLWTSLTGPDQ